MEKERNKNDIKKIIIAMLALAISSLSIRYVLAEEPAETAKDPNLYYSINLDKKTIAKGYTVSAFDDYIKLSLVPGILNEQTRVQVVELNEPMDLPWEADKVSKIIQFEFLNKYAYDNHKPFYIQLNYDNNDNNLKQVFYFDKGCNCWRPLPTTDYPDKSYVRSLIHLPYARIAVFSLPSVIIKGDASWYKYKNGDFAASPDFPKGSKIKVTNIRNNKSVVVTINDYGPDRVAHPNRVIDLDKVAFGKIASLGAGIAEVVISPVSIASGNLYNNVGDYNKKFFTEPNFNIKSAVIFNEKTGEVIWEKNSASTSPLASLTKLVAIKTFLDTLPTLSTVVAYNKQDEEYNYKYCKPWESSSLKIDDGETLTIENLVYASLVGSTNNTIETLVRVSGLNRDDFVTLMNKNVASWGASSTNFVEPTGLAPENVSSPLDYAIIAKEVLKNPIIQKTSTMNDYKFTTVNKKKDYRIKNTNKLIELNRHKIIGSKTGYLNEAGYCLMTKVEKGSDAIITVIFGASSYSHSLQTTSDLINYGLKKLNDKIL
ncbi:MAG: D-alanyl-D-alanine carboxypeptidase DacF precursor [Parcubacteria group bacterium ADurb.Bin316]|nr:MAG: D-alanyl-D-alanine carboxypeptidase DacF precursor [Parcubacteria group bacterium ADurb.Bin316]HOZ56430.1 RlpA-like double-psi beta-barrel domain-containing protein [bacterium]